MFMTEEAKTWKHAVEYTALNAFNRSKWRPGKGQLVVEWRLLLTDDVDSDNAMKLVHDALASALKVNDKRFLPRVISKRIGQERDMVVLTVYDHIEEPGQC